MPIVITRRHFIRLVQLLAASGVSEHTLLASGLFQIGSKSPAVLPVVSGAPFQIAVGSDGEIPQISVPQASPDTSGIIQKSLSNLVGNMIDALNTSTATIANQTYTIGTTGGGVRDTGLARITASGGTILSFSPGKLDYAISDYATITPSLTSPTKPGNTPFVGIVAGIGGEPAYMGKSSEADASFAYLSGSAVWNDHYFGLSLMVSATPSWPNFAFSNKSVTTPVGNVKTGNLAQDAESMTNTLWDMSQDPMNAMKSPF